MEEELINTLKATLEPDVAIIQAAQNHLQQHLHPQPAIGLCLISIVHAGVGIPLPIRQAAAVNLSHWIKERWSPLFAEFIGFSTSNGDKMALPVEAKEPIRRALLDSCSLNEVKLRGPMIKALINVAAYDWPDEFPELIPHIKSLLSVQFGGPESTAAIEGALVFLDDWFYNYTDETGLMSVSRDVLPNLEHILSQAEIYPASIRCRCVSIFNQMLETLWMVKGQYPEASKAIIAEVLPRWLTILEAVVSPGAAQATRVDAFDQAKGEKLALQAQAWGAISTATHFPSHFKTRLSALLSTALSSLSSLQEAFYLLHVSSSAAIDAETDSTFFSTPSGLASKIIDFVGVALQNSVSKSTTSEGTLFTLLPLLRSYSRITVEEQEEWLEKVSEFVAAGDEDELGALNTSMRGRCADILSELILVKEAETLEAVRQAVAQGHEEGKLRRTRGEEGWWKEEEAALALLGGIAEHITEKLEDAKEEGRRAPFDVESIFATSVLPNMAPGSPCFLYGRSFVFASQFASVLPQQLAHDFLTAAVGAIEDDSQSDAEGETIVKISAVRCLKNFHRHLSPSLLAPFAARILSRLGPLLASASEDTLILIVETLQAVAMQEEARNPDSAIPPRAYGDLVFESVKAWAKEGSDRILQSAVEDMLEAFAAHKSPTVALAVIQRAMPLFADLLRQGQSAKQANVMIEGALEFTGAVARGSSGEMLLQSGAVLPFLGPLFDTLGQSDDREVYKNGATLLTSLLSKMADELLSWHDERGVSSVQHILSLVSNMISPLDTSESGGLGVGDVLTTILRKRPESLSTTLPELCTALVTRLSTSASTSLTQSLIVPLAFLIKDHLETVVGLLNSHAITLEGQERPVSSLHVLMKKWCEFASSFQGFWNTRVSTLGLCALLRQVRQSGLNGVLVDGDLIPDDSNMIKTRSRAKAIPIRYTQIPVPAKLLKILVNEYTQAVDGPPSQSRGRGEEAGDAAGEEGFDDDDDDEDGWDDDVDYAKKQRQDAFLSDMLGEDLDGGLESLIAQHDEEQYSDDAIYNMPLRTYLTSFFRELAQDTEMANQLGRHLNAQEMSVLQSAIA